MTQKVDVKLPVAELDAVDRLVESGIYLSRSIVIRQALRTHFKEHKIKPFYLG